MNKRLMITLLVIASLLVSASLLLAQETEEELPECPIFEDQSTEVRTSYYMGEALGYLRSGELTRAEASLDCVILVIDEDYVPAYMTRAEIQIRRENYEAAIEDYSEAIDLDSSVIAAYNNRGIAYAARRDYEEAAADFDRVIELDEDYVPAYNNRAVIYAIEGEYEDAIALLEEVISLTGIDDIVAELTDPERDPNAERPEYDTLDARAYGLLGIVRSRQAFEEYQRYQLLLGGGGDNRIQSAAGALESRITFELRLDDGTWLLVADYSPVGEPDEE